MNEVKDAMNDSTVLACEGLTRRFSDAGHTLEVLNNVSLSMARGERAAIVGSSGSGKSTLLHLLGGLDTPTAGRVHVAGHEMTALGDAERGRLRNASLGFVYQFHHLLPEFTALENVAMPLLVRRESIDTARDRAAELLQQVGLDKRMTHKPSEMSGGERQRAAVARALITRPDIVLADEPTGNLDKRNGEQVFELMMKLNEEHGTSLLIVTHDRELAERMQTVHTLEDGQLVD